jgi:small subunit ribosomal protein S1
MEDLANINNTQSHDHVETSANAPVSSSIEEGQTMPQTETADQSSEEQNVVATEEKKSRPADQWEPLRAKMRAKESVDARIVKWQRNGLEVEIANNGQGSVKAFMPNDLIDRDPNRNIANYFGKTVPVKITSIRANTPADAAIVVSHRAVIEEELRTAGREGMKDLNIGDVVEGKVKSFSKDNVNIDLGTGIDAVIRLRDLSWQHVDHPYEILKRGESVKAKVLSLDRGRRRVQLGIRQLTDDPEIGKYKEVESGQVVKATVKTTGQHGAEIELPNGLIAFLPMSEISWERIGNVSDAVNVGDEVEVKLLTVDSNERRITASRKQLVENPLRVIENTFRVGTDHNGTIKEVTRGGLVVSLAHNTEGFVPRRELSHDRLERLEDMFKAGKPIEGLRVTEYDRRGPRITLSLIAAEKEAQRKTLKNYRATSNASSYSLSDSLAALKEQLLKQEQQAN